MMKTVESICWRNRMVKAGRWCLLLHAATLLHVHAAESAGGAAGAREVEAERLFVLGKALATGDGVQEDVVEACVCFRRAADLGSMKAANNLGQCYLEGRGVARDEAAGAEWMRRASDLGSDIACMNLSSLYLRGRGVPKDAARSEEWLRKAADLGLAEAQFRLGTRMLLGLEGVKQDPAQAGVWFRKAAEQGHVAASNSLASLLEDGAAGKADLPEAVRLFRFAAEHGDAKAQFNLGRLHSIGKGVPKDPVQSFYWLTLGARQNEVTAANLLADIRPSLTKDQAAEAERLLREHSNPQR